MHAISIPKVLKSNIVHPSVNVLKHFFGDQWASLAQNLYGDYSGRRNKSLFKWS